MKKSIRAISLFVVIILIAVCCACTGGKDPENKKAEFDRSFIGDWYGVFKVSEAGGKYEENLGITDDCALRFAIGEDGAGVCYCVINGIGGSIFKDCAAAADKDGVTVAGNIEGKKIEWRFNAVRGGEGALTGLYASGFFGNVLDFMRVSFTLRHCGEEWSGGVIPAGYEYTKQFGFGGIVELFGGSKADLPEVNAEGANLRLSTDAEPEKQPAPDFNDAGRVKSVNGHFSVILPKGFEIAKNDRSGFALADQYNTISYSVEKTDISPLEALAQYLPGEGYTDVYHYDIDGYDCCAAAVDTENGGALVIYGQKEPGSL